MRVRPPLGVLSLLPPIAAFDAGSFPETLLAKQADGVADTWRVAYRYVGGRGAGPEEDGG